MIKRFWLRIYLFFTRRRLQQKTLYNKSIGIIARDGERFVIDANGELVHGLPPGWKWEELDIYKETDRGIEPYKIIPLEQRKSVTVTIPSFSDLSSMRIEERTGL